MRTARALVVLLGGLALPLAGVLAPDAAAQSSPVVSLRIDGVVDPFVANYIAGGIQQAEDEGAPAVLVTIDTPGGLDSSMRKITQAVLNADVPVITYVSPPGARAASAGAFILISGSVAAMAPGTNVGAAHPVGVSGIVQQEKVLEDAVAYIRSLAEGRGRNADWAEEAVRDSRSSSAEEALELGVVDLIEPDVASLLRAVDGREVPVGGGDTMTLELTGVTVTERDMSLGARLLHGLFSPDLAFIFFYLGIGLIILEILTPGIGVSGVLGALMLIAAFVSFGMLPVQLVGIVLLLASVVFFLLELKLPGLGFHTAGGLVTLVLGGLLLFDASVPGARVSPFVIVPVAVLAGLFFAFVVRSVLRMRHMPPRLDKRELIGAEGVAHTAIAPEGVVLVASEQWTAESVAGAIPRGARVRVVGATGLRLKVEPAGAQVRVERPGGPGLAVGGKEET